MDQAELLDVLARLCARPNETATVEFKSNLANPAEIGEYVSALANSAALDGHDRAWLVWGVENGTHAIKGTAFDPFSAKGEGNQSLVMWLQQRTAPRADFTFHLAEHAAGAVVMMAIHPARSAPVAFQNVRHIRIDSHKTRLSEHPDKEARLWAALGQKDDWTGELVSEATLDDLDPLAVDMARRRFVEYLLKNEDVGRHDQIRSDAAGWDAVTLLNKAHITKQGRVTRSALLLLGKDESSHFLSPADTKISWVLRDAQNRAISSQHFGMPLLLSTDQVFARIRNVMIEHMPDGTLFPTALPQYDRWVIREALHNCVAHQDYRLGGKINVVEHPDRLVFSNLGQFIPPSVEWMLEHQSPPEHYRNQWLIDGMIRLRMIDQIGSGIRRMFETQRERFFPLPDYTIDSSDNGRPRVELVVAGQILDVKYTQVLMRRSDLDLRQVLLLDRVQKHHTLTKEAARELKSLKLIEGRAPRHFISAKVADWTGEKARYIHNRGLDDGHYRKLVTDYLDKFGQATRKDVDDLLISKMPDVLDAAQKAHKVRNLLQAMRREGVIYRDGPKATAVWRRGSTKPPTA